MARVLRYEGHMLVYDPHTNGTGWVAMKGIPASLTEVEARSAEELGNFYPTPRAQCVKTHKPPSHPLRKLL